MSVFSSMNISASGMTAQRLRTDIITQNLANVNTTRDADGSTYKRKDVVFAEKDITGFQGVLMMTEARRGSGVKVTQIVEDNVTPQKMVYDPSHPDSNEEGYVTYPNVNTVTEMTNMIDASRAYEANVTAFNAAKSMAMKGLELGK